MKFPHEINRLCQETERRLEEARERTESARRRYLQALVRYETLTQLVTDTELQALTTPGLRHEEQLVAKLKDNLSLAEVCEL